MRQIKFKAWNKSTKEWIYLVMTPENIRVDYGGDKKHHWLQFTGLLDKNGKEIYEGDIVHLFIPDSLGVNYEIVFHKAAFMLKWNDSFSHKTSYSSINKEVYRLEIIGNIYENPELLK